MERFRGSNQLDTPLVIEMVVWQCGYFPPIFFVVVSLRRSFHPNTTKHLRTSGESSAGRHYLVVPQRKMVSSSKFRAPGRGPPSLTIVSHHPNHLTGATFASTAAAQRFEPSGALMYVTTLVVLGAFAFGRGILQNSAEKNFATAYCPA